MKKILLFLLVVCSNAPIQAKPDSLVKTIKYTLYTLQLIADISFLKKGLKAIPLIGSSYPNLDALCALSTVNDIVTSTYDMTQLVPKLLRKSPSGRKKKKRKADPSKKKILFKLLSAGISDAFYIAYLYYHYHGDEARKEALCAGKVPEPQILYLLSILYFCRESTLTIFSELSPYLTKLTQQLTPKRKRKKKDPSPKRRHSNESIAIA